MTYIVSSGALNSTHSLTADSKCNETEQYLVAMDIGPAQGSQ